MKKFTLIISDFESINENQSKDLVGGFSKSFTTNPKMELNTEANNCRHGNCVAGCGGNTGCNTVVGCGQQ